MPAFFQHARLRIFLLSIPLNESLLIRLLVRCFDMLFPVRTPLHNLFAFVHPEIVSVFSELSSQRIDGYNHFCYHIASFLATISRPSRTSRLRARSFFESRCKGTSNIPPSPNFFAIFFHFFVFFSSVMCGSFTLSHFHASAYLEKFPIIIII